MALITPSSLVGSISGRIGGAIFATARSGATLRKAPAPRNRRTSAQLDHRARLSQIYEAWLALTAPQRLAWTRAAESYPYKNRLHLPRTVSGYALFVSVCLRPGSSFLGSLVTPPLMQAAPQPYSVATTIDVSAGYTISWSPGTASSSYQATLFAARTLSPSLQAPPRSWTYLGALSPATSPWTFTSIFNAAMGAPIAGETIHLRLTIWQLTYLPSPSTELAATAVS